MKETAGGVTKEYTYLGGDAYTAPVAAITQSGTTNYFYLLRDYLGNITHQVNTSNAVVAEYNFDAWGRRRSADDWSYTMDANDLALFADRGFTGHEYLNYFNLYNMNGRMYDPLVGRFLNADPVISDGGNTQSYNRYSYVLNNPLRYTDPSGYYPKALGDHPEPAFSGYGYNYMDYTYGRGGGTGSFPRGWNRGDYYVPNENGGSTGSQFGFNVGVYGGLPFYDPKTGGYGLFAGAAGQFIKQNAWSEVGGEWSYKGYIYRFIPSSPGINIPSGGGGITGLPENDFIKYSLVGTSVWAGTIQTGFDAARKIQPTVSTWIKGAKVLGKASNILGVVSVGYDFATETANSSTLANATVMVAGSAIVFFGGVALAPWVAAGGVAYGIISVAGGDEWLNRNVDISRYINIYKPSNP